MNNFNNDYIQYSKDKVKKENKNLALYFTIHITLYVVLFFFVLFFAWYTVFISTHKFYTPKGPSMKGTLNSQLSDYDTDHGYDAVYINTTQKGGLFDIIVIEEEGKDSIIKRLMAQEGDYVSIVESDDGAGNKVLFFYRIAKGTDLTTYSDEQGKLIEDKGKNGYSIRGYQDWRDNRGVTEYTATGHVTSYKYETNFYETFIETETYETWISDAGMVYVQVPEGQIFYMGDNRGHSTDSRENGFGKVNDIVGRCEFIVYNYESSSRLIEVIKYYFKEMEEFFAR